MIKYGFLHGGRQIPVVHHWISSSITLFVLLSIFFTIYPLLRIMLIFWFIYLFIYNKWNGLNYDISSGENTTNCGPTEGIYSAINRIIQKYIFPNFLFFVMLILVIFNVYSSFKNDQLYNPAIKHIMIGFSLLFLLGLVLYALFNFYSKNTAEISNRVKYNPGHKEKVKSNLDNVKLDNYPPPYIPPKLETAEPPKPGSSFLLNTLKNSSLNPLNNTALKGVEALSGINPSNIKDISLDSVSDKIKDSSKNLNNLSQDMNNL
jgi:hypothetical protein